MEALQEPGPEKRFLEIADFRWHDLAHTRARAIAALFGFVPLSLPLMGMGLLIVGGYILPPTQ